MFNNLRLVPPFQLSRLCISATKMVQYLWTQQIIRSRLKCKQQESFRVYIIVSTYVGTRESNLVHVMLDLAQLIFVGQLCFKDL